jgi:hypothetical protein
MGEKATTDVLVDALRETAAILDGLFAGRAVGDVPDDVYEASRRIARIVSVALRVHDPASYANARYLERLP